MSTNIISGGGNRCGRCHRVLKNPQAIEAGYGAVCYRKTFGGSLPGKGRAAEKKEAGPRSKGSAAGRSDYDCRLQAGGGQSVMVIEDLDAGGTSVTNNIEAVVPEAAEQLGVDYHKVLIIYRDSDGIYDGVRCTDGGGFGFYHLGQRDEAAAVEAARKAIA